MRPVMVRIMHPEPDTGAGPLTRWLAVEKHLIAERHVARFIAAGAADVAIVAGRPDDRPFGDRLRELAERERPAGLVILGSGAIPLAADRDIQDLVAAAGADGRSALTNSRFSADVVAIARPWPGLASLSDLATDNALPRWLESEGGYQVTDLRRRWRLAVDVDGPLDLVLLGRTAASAVVDGIEIGRATAAIERIRRVAADPEAELMIAGRTSAAALTWLERRTASRTRVLIEERGLRTGTAEQRPPASVVAALLERTGPAAFGDQLARFADAALVDTRVLLAHRHGRDERSWPTPEDRYASDLLLPERVSDPWLRALTRSVVESAIPVLLGGHSLVGPGTRLVIKGRSWS